MRRLLSVFAVLVFLTVTAVSCTPQNVNEDTQQTDKDKICPPGNPNC